MELEIGKWNSHSQDGRQRVVRPKNSEEGAQVTQEIVRELKCIQVTTNNGTILNQGVNGNLIWEFPKYLNQNLVGEYVC